MGYSLQVNKQQIYIEKMRIVSKSDEKPHDVQHESDVKLKDVEQEKGQ